LLAAGGVFGLAWVGTAQAAPVPTAGSAAGAGADPGAALVAAPAAAAAAPAGWKLMASDDFTSTGLGSKWGTYGGSYSIGANAWSGSEVSAGGGTLRVKMERKTTAGKPYTSGGAAMWNLTQTYGRYEFDAKAPTTPGIDSYITLWPKNDDDKNSMLIELLDKPAVSPHLQAAYLTINYGSGTSSKTVPGSYCGAYHHYIIEWTPSYESITVDGKLLLKSPASSRASRWIGFITSNGDNLTGTPGPNDALPAEFDIQHVRVYSYTGAVGSTTTASPTPTKPSSSPSSSASVSPTSAASASGASGGVSSGATSGAVAAPTEAAAAKSDKTNNGVVAGAAVVAIVASGVMIVVLLRRQRPSGTRRR
jgi:beta-glucanase (GH16 family)